jgi:hypothetical protein
VATNAWAASSEFHQQSMIALASSRTLDVAALVVEGLLTIHPRTPAALDQVMLYRLSRRKEPSCAPIWSEPNTRKIEGSWVATREQAEFSYCSTERRHLLHNFGIPDATTAPSPS